jgi:nickel/cobalt exporter
MTMLRVLIPLIALLLVSGAPAQAHPHVWVSVQSTVVYDASGHPTGIRHAWTFDEMFSGFATQGLDTNKDGTLDRAELSDLAEVNVTSLAEFDYFTFAKAAGKAVALKAPVDYWLEHNGKSLILHFTLPVDQPARAVPGPFQVEVYDPTYFISFSFIAGTPAAVEGAPTGCTMAAQGSNGDKASATGAVSEDFFSNLTAGSDFGEQFANRMTVTCTGDVAVVEEPEPAVTELGPAPIAPQTGGPKAEDRAPASASASAAPRQNLGSLGMIRPDGVSAAPGNSFLGWVAMRQAAFYQELSVTLQRIKADGSAVWLLALLAFGYGVFHAAGPGHGKVVIASYLVASGETLRRGVAISFVSALLQAMTAIAVVTVLSVILGASAQALGLAAYWLEAGSYVAIAVLGILVLWRKAGALLAALRGKPVGHDCGPGCDHHSHMPDPDQLQGPFDWRRAGAAVMAVGLRPCTGAIVVLVFALSQGILWAGVVAALAMAAGTALTVAAIATMAVVAKSAALRMASGGSAMGMVALHGLEAAAGAAILILGAGLLAGLVISGSAI